MVEHIPRKGSGFASRWVFFSFFPSVLCLSAGGNISNFLLKLNAKQRSLRKNEFNRDPMSTGKSKKIMGLKDPGFKPTEPCLLVSLPVG